MRYGSWLMFSLLSQLPIWASEPFFLPQHPLRLYMPRCASQFVTSNATCLSNRVVDCPTSLLCSVISPTSMISIEKAVVVAKIARLEAVFAMLSAQDQGEYLRQVAARLTLGSNNTQVYFDGAKHLAFCVYAEAYPQLA